jgi:hypothetical protein
MLTSYDKHEKRKREVMQSMTYRELLDKCKEKPGWFRPMENSDKEFDIRYRKWATRLDEELRNNISDRKSRV